MTHQLVRGANTPLTARTVRVRVLAPYPLDVTALLVTAGLRVRSDDDLIFWNAPAAGGVRWEAGQGSSPATLSIDLDQVPSDVESVLAVVSLTEETPGGMGGRPAPTVTVEAADATPLVTFVIDMLSTERALLSVELYRRGPGWKVRAIGQGYAGGLAELVAAHGVDVDDPQPEAHPVGDTAHGPVVGASTDAAPQAGQASTGQASTGQASTGHASTGHASTGHAPAVSSANQVPYTDQVWLVWEDACRALAGYRSSADHALLLRDDERAGRARAGRHQEILAAARQRLDGDGAQLSAELATCAPTVPAELAPWDSPSWLTWRPTGKIADGLLVGHLSAPELPGLRVPLILRLPLLRALWISDGPMPNDSATLGWSLVTRLLATVPAGTIGVEVIDPTGSGGLGWLHSLPKTVLDGVLSGGVAAGEEQASARMGKLLDLVDLRIVGADSDADSLIGGPPLRLVVIVDPIGIIQADEGLAHRLLRLVEDGPQVGVTVLCVDLSGGVDSSVLALRVRQACQGLPSGDGSTVGDPWVHADWTFDPEVLPDAALVAAGPAARVPALLTHVLSAHTGG